MLGRTAAPLRARLAVRRRAATDAAAGTLPPPSAPALPAGAAALHSRAAELPGAVFRAKTAQGARGICPGQTRPSWPLEGAMAPPVAEAILQALVRGPAASGGAVTPPRCPLTPSQTFPPPLQLLNPDYHPRTTCVSSSPLACCPRHLARAATAGPAGAPPALLHGGAPAWDS